MLVMPWPVAARGPADGIDQATTRASLPTRRGAPQHLVMDGHRARSSGPTRGPLEPTTLAPQEARLRTGITMAYALAGPAERPR